MIKTGTSGPAPIATDEDFFSPVKATPQHLISLKRTGDSILLKPASVRARMVGQYQSKFKGRGMEFDEVRPYQPGDDIRNIDWRVTARTGRAHTKLFREERERPVFLWLDLSGSMHFGTQRAFKSVAAAEVAALVGWSAVKQGDRIGGMIYEPTESVLIRPGRGKSAATSMINQISNHSSWENPPGLNTGADINHFPSLIPLIRPGSLICLISDFRTMSKGDRDAIAQMAIHSEVILLQITDPLERELPPPGEYAVQHGGSEFSLQTTSKSIRFDYQQRFQKREKDLVDLCRKSGVHLLSMETNELPEERIPQLFRRRP